MERECNLQDVYPTGPGLEIEGYRAACSCGWREAFLFEDPADGWDAVKLHLAGWIK